MPEQPQMAKLQAQKVEPDQRLVQAKTQGQTR